MELLIVIVVIGILAAITVVAFAGVQDRANDSAVKSDMNALAKKLEMYRAQHGAFPSESSIGTDVLDYRASLSAYAVNTANSRNLGVCLITTSTSTSRFVIWASSKSGNWYQLASSGSITQGTGAFLTQHHVFCPSAGIPVDEPGYSTAWGRSENGQAANSYWHLWVQ